jgi:ABC-type glycerol-3-phosphate transport system substrate-binding protein
MSNFKLILIGIFAAAAVFGMMVFSGIISLGGSSSATEVQGSVTVWGTFDSRALSGFLSDFNTRNQKISIIYQQKDAASFDAALIEAIAAGSPPDLVLLPDNLVWRYQNKMAHIPFTSLPAQTFQATFVSAGDIFAAADGYVAVPWATDPLVMYYNRDMLQGVGIALPPATWQDFTASVPLLAKKQVDLTLTQMAAALGSYANVAHAKDILALLMFENGNPFITGTATRPSVHFGAGSMGTDSVSAAQALDFYMAFSNASKQVYTWNAGQALDRDAFTQSSLAYYFGLASELPLIRAANPNLNFGIALPPQAPGKTPVTSGRIYGFAIPKSAPNQILSYTAATLLASSESEQALTTKTGADLALVPVRRDVLAAKPAGDAYLGLLYDAALVQRSWLDPYPSASSPIFAALVRDVSSSSLSVETALTKAAAQLNQLGGTI